MPRSLKKGPFIDGHLARKVDAQNESGTRNVIKTWWEVSEKGLPNRVGDTEQKALVRVRLKRGERLEIRGWHPPCGLRTGCHNVMEHTAITTGADIVYMGVSPKGSLVEREYEGGHGHIPKQK